MFYLKNTLFISNNLTKNQKASLFSFLKSFVKKHSDKSVDEILDLFIEDEEYYKNVDNPHFEWIHDLFDDDNFIKDLKILINENKKQLVLKEKQRPFIEKQKELAKEQRRKASEFKMSKEKPTKKQLYYYNKLCEKYHIEKLTQAELDEKSKLDLRNIIDEILTKNETLAKERLNTDLYQ